MEAERLEAQLAHDNIHRGAAARLLLLHALVRDKGVGVLLERLPNKGCVRVEDDVDDDGGETATLRNRRSGAPATAYSTAPSCRIRRAAKSN